jgi:hypothetical protein
MPKFQEINLINGVTAAGIRQVPHRQTVATAEAVETGSGSTMLIADMQSISQHLINTIDGTYEWLRHPERGPLQTGNSRRRLIDLLTSNKQPSGPKPKLIDLLVPDSWIPASQMAHRVPIDSCAPGEILPLNVLLIFGVV